ncbi:MAG: RecQ family ATP-dependent DNA helicase [Caldilineaceae bacterium]|nr:RecQ family ATP-dependent DNA helicase [Caldilineaceae bacterium]HRJ41595.1 RecQ family ATP-dependent DNA helicase [Caldilineaceae bacterium]
MPLLTDLKLHPSAVTSLPATARNKLLHFLLRWEAWDDALACLEYLPVEALVSYQDMQAEALDGLGRAAESVKIVEERIEMRDSIAPRQRLVYYLLHSGDIKQAQTEARRLVKKNETTPYLWSMLGETLLASGDLVEAEAAFLRHRSLAPSSKQPLLGLARLYQQRGESVTSAAFAVQGYTTQEGERPHTIQFLRRLRDFFAENGDPTRAAEVKAELARRFREEMIALDLELDVSRPIDRRSAPLPTQPVQTLPTPPPLPDLAAVPVSESERAELEAAVERLFGFTSLLHAQTEIMACARRGENVLAILPTGAGKSLCYQLPAFLDGGVTLVISPLIALMKDQVDGLPDALAAQTVAINSSLDGDELAAAIRDVAGGRYRLVYAAPERLRQRPFLHALAAAGLVRLVIDEAHCVSVWGHDFRPDYLHIAQARRDLGEPTLLALTATAPVRVREDIERQLFGLGEDTESLRVIATDTFRPSLRFLAYPCGNEDEKLGHLLDLCTGLEGSGIVYARTRARCEELAGLLQSQGVAADHYHAGIFNRAEVQNRFMRGDIRVIVATIAFGMGVDKPDIRFIVHYGLADSVEAYYQEAGRAGRDGEPAQCLLLHSSSDQSTLTRNANRGRLTIEFLRALYGLVKRWAAGGRFAILPTDELVRATQHDDTQVRVGLSLLEQAGLLVRHYDPPRAVVLHRLSRGQDGDFDAFADGAHLRTGQSVTRSYGELCQAGQIPPTQLEERLLVWQSRGHLSLSPSGRDLLLELPPAPADSATRIDALLRRDEAIQSQRITEIVRYARTRHCRHGHLAAYLGGTPRAKCPVCDNCVDDLVQTDSAGLPDDADQLRTILAALEKHGWGWRSLLGVLRGDASMQERAGQSPGFGALAFRSEAAIQSMAKKLLAAGLLVEEELSHGGKVLGLTAEGRRALTNDSALEGLQ